MDSVCRWNVRLLLLFFPALLIGCASGYSLSADALKYRNTLSDANAFETIRQLSMRTEHQLGVCSAVTNRPGYERATFVSVGDPQFTISSFHEEMTGVSAKVATGTVSTTIYTELVADTLRLNLRQLHKIRVLTELKGYGCNGASNAPLQGYLVMIDNRGMGSVNERPNAVLINVSAQNLDRLLAALTDLSPQGKLIGGAGF
jgi:hypothetical protein